MSVSNAFCVSGLDLDLAVLLAEASLAAYSDTTAKTWATKLGFSDFGKFNRENVQGFWCSEGDVAVLSFRGTQNISHWLRNVRVAPWKHPWGMVHRGFSDGVNDISQDLAEFDKIAKNVKYVWVTGHSLGGALAVLATARLKMNGIRASLYTYGQPKMCFSGFAERFAIELSGRYVRFVNQDDVVPRVPPFYGHFGRLKRIVRPGLLESIQFESMDTVDPVVAAQAEALERIVGRATLESSIAVTESGIAAPLMVDAELPALTNQEFLEFQIALGEGQPETELEELQLERFFPSIKDHAISEYIRLLAEIRNGELHKL